MVNKIKVIEIKELTVLADNEKNTMDGIDISKLFVNSSKVINWKCENGHTFKEKVNVMYRRKHKCFYCTGRQIWPGENDLQTLYPELAEEFDVEKNGNTPDHVSPKDTDNFWWTCKNNHPSFQQSVEHRVTRKTICPYCTGRKAVSGVNDLDTMYPEIAKEWDYENNFDLKPEMFTVGSGKKVWWKCPMNHSYIAMIAKRTYEKTGCPYCSASIGEKTVYKVLNDLNLKYQMQVTFDELTGIKNGKLRYDFGIYENNKLIFLIEYQGRQHYDKINLYGGEKNLEKTQFHDGLKREYAEKYLNVPLLEIKYKITEYDDIFSIIKDFYNITTNKRG